MTDDTRPASAPAPVPWATTQTAPYAASAPPVPGPPSEVPGGADEGLRDTAPLSAAGGPASAPALNPPTWSGRKTAIAAALAIGLSSMGAVAAAAALPSGTSQEGQGQFQRGGFGGPGGQQGQLGGTQPGGRLPGVPGQGADPNSGVPGQDDPSDPGASTT